MNLWVHKLWGIWLAEELLASQKVLLHEVWMNQSVSQSVSQPASQPVSQSMYIAKAVALIRTNRLLVTQFYLPYHNFFCILQLLFCQLSSRDPRCHVLQCGGLWVQSHWISSSINSQCWACPACACLMLCHSISGSSAPAWLSWHTDSSTRSPFHCEGREWWQTSCCGEGIQQRGLCSCHTVWK